jgi:hypothetical protein
LHDNHIDINSSLAHTVSQRLRQIKKIPVELFPLGKYLQINPCIKLTRPLSYRFGVSCEQQVSLQLLITPSIAVVAAGYALVHKLLSDPTLRLSRQNRKD